VVGLLASRLFIRASNLEGSIAPLLGLTAAAGCYGVATWLGASGFLAVYVGGIIVGSVEPAHRQATMAFHDGLARLSQLFMFLLLGLLVFPSQLGPVALRAMAIAAVLTLVARPVSVVLSLVWFRSSVREMAFVSWAGLRGAVPIVLATFPLTAGVPAGNLIFDVAFFVVLLSALVQGSTVGWVAQRLGLQGEPTPWSAIVDVVPIDLFGMELLDVELGADSPAVGQKIQAVPLPGDARIVTVMRGGRVTVPSGKTVLRSGDRLAIAVPSGDPVRGQLSAWAGDPEAEESES
jgi:cell volume regulation protein A